MSKVVKTLTFNNSINKEIYNTAECVYKILMGEWNYWLNKKPNKTFNYIIRYKTKMIFLLDFIHRIDKSNNLSERKKFYYEIFVNTWYDEDVPKEISDHVSEAQKTEM